MGRGDGEKGGDILAVCISSHLRELDLIVGRACPPVECFAPHFPHGLLFIFRVQQEAGGVEKQKGLPENQRKCDRPFRHCVFQVEGVFCGSPGSTSAKGEAYLLQQEP